ncbi:MAG: diguanylate cyclase [Polyangiaceae bacterium]
MAVLPYVGVSIFPQSLPPVLSDPSVLIVEGLSGLGPKLREALEQAGCKVHMCADGQPAAGMVEMLMPDLVLIDADMSSGTGFELCGELRATDAARQIPILIASNDLSEQTVSRGLLCGADDVVAVDRRLMELQARVRVQLRNKRDRDRLMAMRLERDSYQIEARIDALTGIPNRRTFDARMTKMFRSESDFSLLFVDIDHFKKVNDQHGHDAGDKVLQAVAQCLYGAKRSSDTVARYGGEEFVIMLPSTDGDDAFAIAEEHRTSVEKLAVQPWLDSGKISISIGLAVRERGDTDPARICRRADEALYEAKRSGRNRVMRGPRSPKSDVTPDKVEAFILKQLATGRAGLPLLPEAAQEALRLAEDPHTDVGKIGKLVDRDPSLAARFVALAGSAVYSGRVRPTNTTTALVRIGLHAARDLLLQVVFERVHEKLPLYGKEVAESFARSVRTAVAARMLAKRIAPTYDLAYLCGLLHDIGEARLYRILAELPEAQHLGDAVSAIVQRHHEAAGAEVARVWKLPGDILTACEKHHDVPIERAPMPVRIVMGAAALVGVAEGSAEEMQDTDNPHLILLQKLGVSQGVVQLLAENVRIEWEKSQRRGGEDD